MKQLLFFSLLFLCFQTSFAQMLVFDATTAKQAVANGTTATASESLIEKEFDTMRKEQNKVQAMMTVVEQHLSKVEKIQKDISAFKREGATIKLFVFKTQKALKSLQELSKDFTSRELGVIGSYKVIASLSADIYGICSNMVTTVIDAKYALPGLTLPKQPTEQINLLEPQQRLAFYDRCCYEMDIINFKIQQMHYEIISSNSLMGAFSKISPEGYWNMEFAKNIANDIVGLWKK